MKQTILDTNFILTCVKQKIDFFEGIRLMGIQIVIPKQVIKEIEKITNSSEKNYVRENAKLSLRLLESNKFKKIDLKKKYVDKALINFAKEHPKVIVATLDRELKKKIKNKKLVIREKKRLEII